LTSAIGASGSEVVFGMTAAAFNNSEAVQSRATGI
jgi:hypothetical protein